MKRQIWKDSIEERRERYREILAKAPSIAVPCILPGTANHSLPGSEEYVIETIAYYVTGPALYAYIDWVIHSAVKAGQKRLYFLARDGYLMHHAAKIYCEENHINLDLRYLYCSRYALRIPMYHLNREDTMEYICRNGLHITPVRLLRRSGMEEELCRRLAEEYFPQWNPNQELTRQQLAELTGQLKANEAFWELCAAHSREVYPEAERYLVQEGMLDDTPYALVDSGWIGSMQKTLGQLIGRNLHGYYWGLYDIPEGTDKEAYSAYYFSASAGESEKVAFNNNLFEVLYSAPHGMTIGYRDGKPILGNEEPRQVELIRRMEPVLIDYMRTVCKRNAQKCVPHEDLNEHTNPDQYRVIIRELFDCFMCHPIKEEAEVFGSIPFSDDIFAETDQRLAGPVSEEVLNSNHPMQKVMRASGLKKEKEIVLPWYEGSAVLSSSNPDKHLKAYQNYKKLLTKRQERNWRNKT